MENLKAFASKFSLSNLLGIDAIIQTILNQTEVEGVDTLIKIPVSLLERYNLQLSSGEALVSKMNKEIETKLKIQNKYLEDTVHNRGFEVITAYDEPGKYSPTNNPSIDYLHSKFGLSLSDLRSYLLLQVGKGDLAKLSELHEELDSMNRVTAGHIPSNNIPGPIVNIAFENGILNIRNYKVIISKSKNSAAYSLLTTLFKDPQKLWNYDEIWEDLYGEEYQPSEQKKIYNIAYYINGKIAQETNIKKFLEITSMTIKITEEAFKKS